MISKEKISFDNNLDNRLVLSNQTYLETLVFQLWMTNELVEYIHKVLVVGDVAVGKTSFIHRLVKGNFSTVYKATVRKKKKNFSTSKSSA